MSVQIYKEFTTKADAEEFRERVYTCYHPLGYGTSIRIEHKVEKGLWVASGSRAESCD